MIWWQDRGISQETSGILPILNRSDTVFNIDREKKCVRERERKRERDGTNVRKDLTKGYCTALHRLWERVTGGKKGTESKRWKQSFRFPWRPSSDDRRGNTTIIHSFHGDSARQPGIT